MRERAQQSWPALPKTAPGAAAAAALEVGVGEDDVGRLAAELERDALDRRRRRRAAIPRPDLGRAGEGDLGHVGVLDEPLPADRPGPATTLSTPSGSPASSAIRSSSSAVSGVSSAGLRTTVLPAASAGRDLPGGDHQREVPGHDQPDDAERLAEGHVDAAGDRDRLPEQPLGRAGVVAEGLDDHADLAAGVADRLAGVAGLEADQLLQLALERVGDARRIARARRRARRRATPGRRPSPPRRRRRPPPTPARGISSAITSSVAGSMTASVPSLIARSPPFARPRPASRSRCLDVLLGMPEDAERVAGARGPRSPRRRRRRHGAAGDARPSPEPVDALVVVGLDRTSSSAPPRRAASEPGSSSHPVVAERARACARWRSSPPSCSGRCWTERAAAARR